MQWQYRNNKFLHLIHHNTINQALFDLFHSYFTTNLMKLINFFACKRVYYVKSQDCFHIFFFLTAFYRLDTVPEPEPELEPVPEP